MPKVTLSRAWNPGVEQYVAGDQVEVSEEQAKWLESSGAIAAPKKVREPVPQAPEPEPVTDEAPAEREASRPARAASTDEWRRFAASKGISTKGLSKQEIIAATR